MKYYIIQKQEQKDPTDFYIVKVEQGKVDEFEKRYAGKVVVTADSFFNLIKAFEKSLVNEL